MTGGPGVKTTYIVCAVQGGKGVWVEPLAHGELVRDLEERIHAEDLGEIRTHAGKHEVVEEDIALHLLSQVLDVARVAQSQFCAPVREGPPGVAEADGNGIVRQKGQG